MFYTYNIIQYNTSKFFSLATTLTTTRLELLYHAWTKSLYADLYTITITAVLLVNPLRTVVAYIRQGNKLDYHAQTNRYNFTALHSTNLKLLSFCSVYSAENSNVLGRM